MNKKKIPFILNSEKALLDISFVFEKEKPAGKHGFLGVKNDMLTFEDGSVPSFWGTNVNSAANFPEHHQAEGIARRMAAFGINIVRFHQLDAEWSTPNIFQFTKGERKGHTKSLDPESMDRLDFFIMCLKKEGIYIYMDMLTYRKFKSGDGVDCPEDLADAAKPYSNFDRKLIELQKEFNEMLWTHYNPHTSLRYKDDPAIVLTEITNENDIFYPERKVILEPYRERLEKDYRSWAEDMGITLGPERVDFREPDRNMTEFFIYLQKRYFREIYNHLRGIGLRIPIAGTNWSTNAGLLEAQSDMDFMDAHYYWYDWQWQGNEKKFKNKPMFAAEDQFLYHLTFSRVAGKPFFVSEWDDPWPNECRAASPLILAAIGSFQQWQGFAIHTYRYHNEENVEMIGKPITSDAIGGVYYRGGVFDTFNDPAKFGLFFHAALLFRRCDIKPAVDSIEVHLPDPMTTPESIIPVHAHELHKVIVFPRNHLTSPSDIGSSDDTGSSSLSEKKRVQSDTGEIVRDWGEEYGFIDSPRSKILYGMLGKKSELSITGLTVRCKSDFAVVALSSLTDLQIGKSNNMLLTVVGRCDNSRAQYNEDHSIQLDCGESPVEIDIIQADLILQTQVKGLRVCSISDKGFLIGTVPSRYEEDSLIIEIGRIYPSMYYLIQAE